MKKKLQWLVLSALCAIGLPGFARAELEDDVGVGYVLPEDRDDGILGIFMPGEDIPDNVVYDHIRYPVKFMGFVYECHRYGDDANKSFCEDTYTAVWRLKHFDVQFPRFDFGYPGSDRTSVIDRGVTVGIAISFHLESVFKLDLMSLFERSD